MREEICRRGNMPKRERERERESETQNKTDVGRWRRPSSERKAGEESPDIRTVQRREKPAKRDQTFGLYCAELSVREPRWGAALEGK
jgi:hypothetical protein